MITDTLLGATKKDIMLVTIIGIFLLVGGSVASYIAIQGFDDELTKKMIADYHGIIVLGAGGGLVVLGITVREKLTRRSFFIYSSESVSSKSRLDGLIGMKTTINCIHVEI